MRGAAWNKLGEALIAAAESHGANEDPDHEVGDLQMILRLAWKRVAVEARESIAHELAPFLDQWGTP